MSQVRKLQNSGVIENTTSNEATVTTTPTENKYKILFDGMEVYLTDDQIKQIADDIASLPREVSMYISNAIPALKSGE